MIRERLPLMEAARAGNAAALAQLLHDCQPDLRRFARRTCATTEDAEDAVQLALWQLYRQIGALRTVATFARWLFRIVERECFRLFRRGGGADAGVPAAEPDALAAPAVPYDLRLDLARAVERLPALYREVLVLRDIQELTAPEVAAELGLSLAAVKSRLHRARAMVREQLLQSGYWLKDGEVGHG